MVSTLSLIASIAMAVGAPLVYADQAYSISKRRNSAGFSKDVCAVLLIANIARCFWWLTERYELALLLQSVLMIVSQLGMLSLVLRYQEDRLTSSSYTASYEDYLYPERQQQQRPRPPPQSQNRFQTSTPSAADQTLPSSVPKSAPAASSDAGIRSLFSAPSFGGSRGNYIPLLSDISLPPLPLLDRREAYGTDFELPDEGEDHTMLAEEEDLDPVSLPMRIFRRVKRTTMSLGKQAVVLLGVRNDGSRRRDGSDSSRPLGFWTWTSMPSYLIFLFLYSCLLLLFHLLFSSLSIYNSCLGFFALGLESSLPLPQLLDNHRRKSLSGFRLSVLGGWLFGDIFKTGYFIIHSSPWPFLLGGFFALSIDVGIVIQCRMFKEQTEKDEEEERKKREIEDAEEARRRPTTREEEEDDVPMQSTKKSSTGGGSRRQETNEWDEDLDQEDAVLFDSMSLGPSKGKGGAAGDLGRGGQMFTIEADDE